MATQNAKFIDVTKTFVPLDPNSFPVSMHGTSKEDSPEQRIPVMAYEGMNILPTAHGYISYFGINRVLDVNTIPGQVDEVFIIQNQFYANIAVALTDIGIFIKIGSDSGAWDNPIVIAAPTDPLIHNEWTYTIIARKLYCYQSGGAEYYRFDEDITTGLVVVPVTPTFLNMVGQHGIFQAGGRLGFWDSSNAISWSNLADFSDFTPSITTLANVVTFSDVKGRIVTVRPHGGGFIIYATKSIVFIRPDEQATFQWDPSVIHQALGITYPRQCVVGMPDTTHFAYTPGGLLKISNGVSEVIVPEVTDVLQRSSLPIYLYMMSNRYLYLEVMDPEMLNSLIQASTSTLDDLVIKFPGGDYTLEEVFEQTTEGGGGLCDIIGYVDGRNFPDNNPTADPLDNEPYDPLYAFRPNWVAYLSTHNGYKDITSWSSAPVPTVDPYGIDALQNPGTDADDIKSDTNTQEEATGQRRVTGADAYVDGKWTIERFIAVQVAIWEMEEEALATMIEQIEARAKTVVKETPSASASAPTYTYDKTLIDTYSLKYAIFDLGMTYCKVWLTRALLYAVKMYRIKENFTESVYNGVDLSPIGYTSAYNLIGGGPTPASGAITYFPTAQAVADDLWHTPPGATVGPAAIADYYGAAASADGRMVYIRTHDSVAGVAGPTPPYSDSIYACYAADVGYTADVIDYQPSTAQVRQFLTADGRYTFRETMVAHNKGYTVAVEPPIFDTGYMILEGWFYKNIFTKEVLEYPMGPCNPSKTYPENHFSPGGVGGCSTGDCVPPFGKVCTEEFIPVVIPGEPEIIVDRPPTQVVVPAGDFLLQIGDIVPPYPTMYGALVYDLHLKKWGKMNQAYRLLLDYSPINNAGTGVIPYTAFGILGGIVGLDQKIRLFDRSPVNSYITYGKIGYYRQGFTTCEEVKVQFAEPSSGAIQLQPSLDGNRYEFPLVKGATFENTTSATIAGGHSGAWHNIKISGVFNIKYIEFRGFAQGKR